MCLLASKICQLALATGALVLAAASVSAPVLAAEHEVRLNEVLRSLFYTPQYVSLRIGAFEQEGIKIIGPKTTWGSQASLTEIVSGNSDVVLMGPEAASLTQEASPERRLLNFAQLTATDGSFILSKKPMSSFKIADLKGTTIVTAGKGSTPALVLEELLKQAGLDPKKDVNIRYIPQSANIIPSFLESNTDFAQAFEPFITQAVAQQRGYRVASVGSLIGPLPYTAYMASSEYIKKNPAVIQGLTNAIYKGLLWTEAHSPQEIAALVAPYFKDVPAQEMQTVIEQYKKAKVWAPTPLISPEGMKRELALMVGAGILKQQYPYEQVVDPTFAKNAMQTIKQ
jgi:NitT/TauT family transport system substrate-binding protein